MGMEPPICSSLKETRRAPRTEAGGRRHGLRRCHACAFAPLASLMAHPFSLLALLGAWCFLYAFRAPDQPVVLFGRAFTDRETLLGLVVASLLAFFLTSVASLIISGLLVGAAIVAAHGACRMPEDLFLDDPSAASNGSTTTRLLSFLASPGSGV